MGRTLSWVANGLLFVFCCALVADTANAIFASLLSPAPSEVGPVPDSPAPTSRSWSDRQVILSRNLFNASILTPSTGFEPEPEELEATRLPLSLVGTAAASDPRQSWAAVADQETRETKVVRVNDLLREDARVLRIERRRIVLSERGSPRELALDEEGALRPPPQRSRTQSRAPRRRAEAQRRSTLGENVQRLAEDRYAVPRADVEEATRNPASLFSQARILPKYEEGELIGVQISSIQPGSLFEEIGIQDGEVITEFNGIQVNSVEETQEFVQEFASANEFTVVVEGPEGVRTLHFTVPEE